MNGLAMKLRSLILLLTLTALTPALQGCVYRLAIQQGNIADAGDVEQVKVGMTPSQVRFLLGTPLVDDPFNADRWDYVYHTRVGRKEPSTKSFITVFFEAGVVSQIETRDEAPLKRAKVIE